MKLEEFSSRGQFESRLITPMPIIERDDGLRWNFGYSNWHADPTPEILLLGAYRHPNTGNQLVGGINLHYLNRRQRDALARTLPEIMRGRNLYERWHIGDNSDVKELFQNFYRTYNAAHIHGVTADVMYPKYGFLKTAKNWLGKLRDRFTKTKAQRQQELEPQFPTDIGDLQDRLDQAVMQQQQVAVQHKPELDDTEEMRSARDAFIRHRAQQQIPSDQEMDDAEHRPVDVAQRDLQDPATRPQAMQQTQPEVQPSPEEIRAQNQEDVLRAQQENQEELDQATESDPELEESIAYYSPLAGGFVVKPAIELLGPAKIMI